MSRTSCAISAVAVLGLALVAQAEPVRRDFVFDSVAGAVPASRDNIWVDNATCTPGVQADLCGVFSFPGLPLAIPDDDDDGTFLLGFISEGTLEGQGLYGCVINDLNMAVEISHTYVADLVVDGLFETSPQTISPITLVSQPAACPYDDIDALFDDQSVNPPDSCQMMAPAIEGIVQPTSPLSVLNGGRVGSVNGQATRSYGISVRDLEAFDTGSLDAAAVAIAMDCLSYPCSDDLENGVACLHDGRFRIQSESTRGGGQPYSLVQLNESLLLGNYFHTENLVTMNKVIDNCGPADVYTFWHGGITQYETTVTVTDLETLEQRVYVIPASAMPASRRDTWSCN